MKKLILAISAIMIFMLPASSSAQMNEGDYNEMTGLMITTTAGTLGEGDFRFEGYSAFYLDQILSASISGIFDSFVENMGASMIYGLSRNTELGLNVQSFDNIFGGGSITIPEMHLNCKVNLMPKADSTGIGFVIQLLRYSGSSLTPATDMYLTATSVFQEAIQLAFQYNFFSENVGLALVAAPYSNNNVMLEMLYDDGNRLLLLPGFKMGKSESGFQLKLALAFDVMDTIDLESIPLIIRIGLGF